MPPVVSHAMPYTCHGCKASDAPAFAMPWCKPSVLRGVHHTIADRARCSHTLQALCAATCAVHDTRCKPSVLPLAPHVRHAHSEHHFLDRARCSHIFTNFLWYKSSPALGPLGRRYVGDAGGAGGLCPVNGLAEPCVWGGWGGHGGHGAAFVMFPASDPGQCGGIHLRNVAPVRHHLFASRPVSCAFESHALSKPSPLPHTSPVFC